MKKLILLLGVASLSVNANAQLAKQSIVKIGENSNVRSSKAFTTKNVPVPADQQTVGVTPLAKTTAGGSRWYNIVEAISAYQVLGGAQASDAANFSGLMIQDMYDNKVAAPLANFGGTIDTLFLTTFACVFDPAGARFNDETNTAYNTGNIAVTRKTTSYTVDSVNIYGVYHRNPAKPLQVDTLRVSFEKLSSTNLQQITGAGLFDQFGDSTLNFPLISWDSIKNTIPAAATTFTKDFYLTAASLNDTVSLTDQEIPGSTAPLAGFNIFKVATGGIALTTAQFLGAGVTFISGDSTFNKPNQVDTLFTTDASGNLTNTKHNFFAGLFSTETPGGVATYVPTTPFDYNTGGIQLHPPFERGFQFTYFPTILLETDLQYTYMDFHVKCSSCYDVAVNNVTKTVSAANAYPNPATGQVTIPFTLNKNANATVTVVNTLGQIISTQSFTSVTSAKASVNTAALAAGVYFYTVEANGDRNTGRFVVAH